VLKEKEKSDLGHERSFYSYISCLNVLNQLPFDIIEEITAKKIINYLDLTLPASKSTLDSFDQFNLGFILSCIRNIANEQE